MAEGLDAAAVAGGRGQFDVFADDELVFSKQKLARFPADGEVRELLRRD